MVNGLIFIIIDKKMCLKTSIFTLITTFCLHGTIVDGYSYDVLDPRVRITRRAAGYNLNMPENNHDADFRRALFTIYDYDHDADPPYLKDNPGFNYTIERHFTSWVLYSESSFDYETDLRFHVINLGVGDKEFKTLTLLIDNIDDEPPVLTCPEHLSLEEGKIYDAASSPLRCTVYDPDGFLNKTTFSLKGENKDNFEFVLPDVIDDMAQLFEVPIINKKPFSAKDSPRILIVEVKDGAGHNTVPEADATLNIEIVPSQA